MKKVVSLMVGIIAVLLMAPVSGSADEAGRAVTVSPVAGFYLPASGIDGLKTGVLAGLKVDTTVADAFGIEGDIGYLLARRGDSTQHAYLFSMQLLYSFLLRRNLTPFVTFGIGGIIFDRGKSGPTMSVGIGTKYFLWEGLALRADLRDVAALRSADNNIEFTIGVSYLFGAGGKGGAVSRSSQQEGTGDEERIPAPTPAPTEVEKAAPAAPTTATPAVPAPVPAEIDKEVPSAPVVPSPAPTEMEKGAPDLPPVSAGVPKETRKVASAASFTASDSAPVEAEKEIPAAPAVPASVPPAPAPVEGKTPKTTLKPAETAAAGPARGAKVFTGITFTADSVVLNADGGIGDFKAFTLRKPSRLVVDVGRIKNKAALRRMSSPVPGITQARIAIHRGKVRVVLDTDRETFPPYRLVTTAEGLRVVIANIPSVATKSGLAGIPAEREHLALSSVVAADSGKELAAKDLGTCPDQPVAGKAEIPGTLLEETLEFNTNRSNIRRGFFKAAQRIARFMKNNPETSALVLGHADNTGRVDHNVMLSQKRAESVKNYLAKRYGIAPARLGSKAFGCSWPIGDNSTAEGRRKNRVTVTIITGTANDQAKAALQALASK